MNVITVKRTVFRQANKRSRLRRSFRELTRGYFARENSLEFAIEALLFAIIVAISAWPIFAAAGALNELFQRPVG
jgi:ribonuclease P protein component